ncbi:MAG: 4Fe-4S binding protein, partial [Atopobium sp.]|nr:4Fe-4S binding protein [Atopobium sp.]
LAFANKGDKKTVVPPFEEPENCIGCGACAFICPTDCIGIEESGDERQAGSKPCPTASLAHSRSLRPLASLEDASPQVIWPFRRE